MAAGLSQKREYEIQYRMLQDIRRLLHRAGVVTRYADRKLFGDFFTVSYRRLNASNGEAAMLLAVEIQAAENRPREYYEFMAFNRGIARVTEIAKEAA